MCADIAAHFRATAHLTGLADPGPRVWQALRAVPREDFAGAQWRALAWDDRALPIGAGQTISQPFIVALMTALAEPEPQHRVLEVGTGCGWQAAVLAQLAAQVVSIERIASLAELALEHLRALHIGNVEVHVADGWLGWPARAPYDRIVVTAGPEAVPGALLAQLARPGRLVVPVGPGGAQVLRVIDLWADGRCSERDVLDVRFVPMPKGLDRG
ncbi:MAG TPA: protein-L-isoaspartate(D-aspartate) O-methyltransferase [Rubrivivax sp.]|nr:protein-L-isoaspartate(D-aspartate) O-methyltransferase [Rubrivivax sp.]HPO17689.1 protein-L-isoaspartate(D-aspartate) O-methyltransferase [Rubrivivax sp.]